MDGQGPGLVPLIAVYGIQHRACGPSYLGGGPAADARYRGWVDGVAKGIGGMWIERPGFSNGTCNGGPRPGGGGRSARSS